MTSAKCFGLLSLRSFLHLLNRDTIVGRRQCPRMLKSAMPRRAEVSETPLLLTVADVTESVVVIFVH